MNKVVDYKRIFESMTGSRMILAKDLRIIAVNDRFLETTHTSRHDLVGRPLFELFPSRSSPAANTLEKALRASLRTVLDEQQPDALPIREMSYCLGRPDAEPRYWSILNNPVLDGGEVKCIIHRVEDLTELVTSANGDPMLDLGELRQELIERTREIQEMNHELEFQVSRGNEQLRQADLRFRQALDSLMEGVQIIGFDWRYLYVNDVLAEQSGYSREQLLGRTMMQMYPQMERTDMFKTLQECMRTRRSACMTNLFTYPDGRSRHFELSIEPVNEGLFILSTDITARKQAEDKVLQLNSELEQANKTLEDRVAKRNQDLILANEHLEVEAEKNRKLSLQLAEWKQAMMDSIIYARRIQDAVFPDIESLGFFRDRALMAMPRDVVSGDVLWFHETEDRILFAIADCTGHGVPGAMMSLLANNLLERRLQESIHTDPDQLLRDLDDELEHLLNRHSHAQRINDGMDIGLFRLDKRRNILDFAGAQIGCFLLRNGALTELIGGRYTIGGHRYGIKKNITAERIQLRRGDRLVLSTDGYRSQIGGERDKKINKGPFMELLKATAQLPAKEAISALRSHFTTWMGTNEQVDDVLIVILDA